MENVRPRKNLVSVILVFWCALLTGACIYFSHELSVQKLNISKEQKDISQLPTNSSVYSNILEGVDGSWFNNPIPPCDAGKITHSTLTTKETGNVFTDDPNRCYILPSSTLKCYIFPGSSLGTCHF